MFTVSSAASRTMGRALTVKEVLNKKRQTFPFDGKWSDAFGQPERTGVWFIWGRSGNGKTSFVMQLIAELCKYDRVAFDSMRVTAYRCARSSCVMV